MKKIMAFITAFVMFVASAGIMNYISCKNFEINSKAVGTWINTKKDASYVAVSSGIGEKTYLMMGSSEFQHGKDTKYHPSEIFRQANLNVMCIGAAKNQSLSHAITLGAVGNELKTKKVALILSPSWFSKKGIDKASFSARFSETQYLAMMDNPNLSDQLKNQLSQRVETLLQDDLSVKDSFERDKQIADGEKLSFKDYVTDLVHKKVISKQEMVSTGMLWFFTHKDQWEEGYETHELDWDSLAKEADEEFAGSANNEFHIRDSIYMSKVLPMYKERKGKDVNRSYGISPEYEDLKLFLEVCKELDIEAELIILPVNGYWYDYTEFPVENREIIVEKVEETAEGYDAKVCSFFNECYTPGFLEDIVHPAGKGWVRINEEVFNFFTEN